MRTFLAIAVILNSCAAHCVWCLDEFAEPCTFNSREESISAKHACSSLSNYSEAIPRSSCDFPPKRNNGVRSSCEMQGVIQNNECYSVSSDAAKLILCNETKVPEGVMVSCRCCFDPEDITTKHYCNLNINTTQQAADIAADNIMVISTATTESSSYLLHALFLLINCYPLLSTC